MTKWPHHPNLRKKPHAPSKGRGPVQRAIRRAFMASGAGVLTSTEIYDWAHGRRRFGAAQVNAVRCLLADVANAAGNVRAGRPRSDHRKALALAAARQP